MRLFVPMAALLLLAGCTPYQCAVLNSAEISIRGVQEVIVPDDARARPGGPAGRMTLKME